LKQSNGNKHALILTLLPVEWQVKIGLDTFLEKQKPRWLRLAIFFLLINRVSMLRISSEISGLHLLAFIAAEQTALCLYTVETEIRALLEKAP
jgi:hypothetical protein